MSDGERASASPDGEASPSAELTEAESAELHERRLIRRLRHGDERAFTILVRNYQHRVFNIVFRMLGNREEAEDVAQEVFVTVFKSSATFRGESKFSTWLYRVAINHCKNRLKYLGRRGRHRGRSLDDLTDHDLAKGEERPGQRFHASIPRPDQVFEGQQMESILQLAIASLEDEHRALIVLRDIQGLAYQEIAEITGLALGTIKSRLHRARMALKDAVEKQTK